MRFAVFGVVSSLAAAAMLAIAATPLALFLAQYYEGNLWVEANMTEAGVLVARVHYNITVPLTDLDVRLQILSGNGTVLYDYQTHRDELAYGDVLEVPVDLNALHGAREVHVYVKGRIGGLYEFSVDYRAPVSLGG